MLSDARTGAGGVRGRGVAGDWQPPPTPPPPSTLSSRPLTKSSSSSPPPPLKLEGSAAASRGRSFTVVRAVAVVEILVTVLVLARQPPSLLRTRRPPAWTAARRRPLLQNLQRRCRNTCGLRSDRLVGIGELLVVCCCLVVRQCVLVVFLRGFPPRTRAAWSPVKRWRSR